MPLSEDCPCASSRLGVLALNSDFRVVSPFVKEEFHAKTPRRKDARGDSRDSAVVGVIGAAQRCPQELPISGSGPHFILWLGPLPT